MDTAPLKAFATRARLDLIRGVGARLAAVLAPASSERVEQPRAVGEIEHLVQTLGGGAVGRDALVDRVAYTWFNRLIALRFMDANGYTGVGVVSAPAGRDAGQPEILADAKRGVLDPNVVSTAAAALVTSLLNNTRRSLDPQGEAYGLLLAEYCRYWNRAMPFMFEREGDYTELLMPADLLADGSVMSRAVSVLTPGVCQDVEVIGWLYQFYISDRKDEVFAGFKKGKKAGAEEIPAATQLFTPDWIVRYLVENTLGRLWLLNRPSSLLANHMPFYVPPATSTTDFVHVASPEELRVLDPACGSGHMLTYAFDLLYAIYEEEGYAPSEIPSLILRNNLFGTEIDARAGALAAFALTMKARSRQRTFLASQCVPQICVLDPVTFDPDEVEALALDGVDRLAEESFWNQFRDADTRGSLIVPNDLLAELRLNLIEKRAADTGSIFDSQLADRAGRLVRQVRFLAQRYHVVVTNPPYMGTNNMGSELSAWLVDHYPLSKSDLMTAFMERAELLTAPLGMWGMINLPSWPFLTSFEALRRTLLTTSTFESFLHLGRGVFGSDFGSVAFVVSRRPHPAGHVGTYRRLFEEHVAVRPTNVIRDLFLDRSYRAHEADQSSFLGVPGVPFAYWLSGAFLSAFERLPALSSVAAPKQGLATANDARFLRFWFEVSHSRIGLGMRSRTEAKDSGRKWFPFNKGGAFRRWYGNIEHVINWEDDGHELMAERPKSVIRSPQYYFQPAVTWSNVSSGAPAFRAVDPGVVFGHVGQSLFADESTRVALLAILNSSFGAKVLEVLAPTIHYEVGSIAKVPVALQLAPEHEVLVRRLIAIARDDWNSRETSIDFTTLSILLHRDSGRLETAISDDFERWQQLAADTRAMEEELSHLVAEAYGLQDEIDGNVRIERVSLANNPYFRFEGATTRDAAKGAFTRSAIEDLVSYAVGCMFGRYSLDVPGLVLATQNDAMNDYAARVSTPTFAPDRDNVIPLVDGDWFEDDIVARFRRFLRAAFGDQHFAENLRFVTDVLGTNDLRDYFVRSFYKDHVQRYRKRPIYWLFSSPKGSFNALIYMHRYTSSTASTVLNEYLREFRAKLDASRQHHERVAAGGGSARDAAAAQKEVERLRKVLVELDEYEHDVLYPLAAQQLKIDLDDGVKANYPKFGAALKPIPGLQAADD